jgi:hypothetical protein
MPMSRDERNRRRRLRKDTRREDLARRLAAENPPFDWDRAIAGLRVMLEGLA